MSNLHYLTSGQGPMVVLSHALGCNLHMWDEVASELEKDFAVLRYDHRGHGKSPDPGRPFTMDDLADDAAGLIRAQSSQPVHFVGLSMGGMTAQAIAARYPGLVRSIVIANSASRYDEQARSGWNDRIETVRSQGVAAISEGAMQRWFTPEFRASETGAERVATLRRDLENMDGEPYAAACAAVAGINLDEGNRRIGCPALVIAGSRDEATPVAMSEAMARDIRHSTLRILEASHLSAVEQPQAFARLLRDFFSQL